MDGRMARAMVVGLTLVAAAGRGATADDGWTTYANPRFGSRADYPAGLFTRLAPPPDNGDGQQFSTADGRATLTIWGRYNIDADTPKSYVARLLADEAATASYVQTTARFYVLSSVKDGQITYERCNFPVQPPDGTMDCFSIAYPAAERGAFDPIVVRISRSLRGGKVQ